MAKSIEQIEREECRLKFLQVLYDAGHALRAKTVRSVLDNLNCSLTWDDFMRHVEWLVSEQAIHAFPSDLRDDMTNVERAKYVSKMKRASFDSPECAQMMLRIRSLGRHHIEGNAAIIGVAAP